MKQVAQLIFRDGSEAQQALAIVRCGGGQIALCLSLESNGDVEVTMDKSLTEQLIDALTQAVRDCNSRDV